MKENYQVLAEKHLLIETRMSKNINGGQHIKVFTYQSKFTLKKK